MGTCDSTSQLGSALFGKSKRALLALFYVQPEQSFYGRQVMRMVGIGQGAVQRELARLVAAGLVVRTRVGSQVHYQANAAGPVFAELKSLMLKTAGVADVLREALAGLAEHITVAFVHGSLAKGTAQAGSDVDVLVIGAASFGEVVLALQPAQKAINREVNPAVYAEREFQAKLQAKHHFLTAVMHTPKVFLVGGERELKRLAEGAVADRGNVPRSRWPHAASGRVGMHITTA
jgi:predicted nucleotidyltransferase